MNLKQLETEYQQAQAADREAMQAHLEIVDRYYEGQPGLTQADLFTAAQVADLTYADRQLALRALDAAKAALLDTPQEETEYPEPTPAELAEYLAEAKTMSEMRDVENRPEIYKCEGDFYGENIYSRT